ncbi:MAG: 1-(5-phosphoribosyl)-5-[(5-phosphoribosylamino)methylideneamino] imidazole-4-carboxamide isomerase [Proteobacteria bacterium]|nr:1-(5-phosphoribosyl)-5-[(5-phosphoribosylamino)methylideneamino] imidazole-4-carboxamide isomerase [Pseudomonadota bacterium]
MILYPSIDLLECRVVRLYQGKFQEKTTYNSTPSTLLQDWYKLGASHVHIVDLEATKGHYHQRDLVASLLKNHHKYLHIQVAGGIRQSSDVQALLSLGAQRVVIGSAVVEKPDLVHHLIRKYSASRITLACDVLADGEQWIIQTRGWQRNSQTSLRSVIDDFLPHYNVPFLITDIAKDGTLKGPAWHMYSALKKQYPSLSFIISGGVSTLEDLKKAQQSGAFGCIIGKALHDEVFSLKEALSYVSS